MMREQIITEIQRLASENGGAAPGVAAFANATGITQGRWRGVYWARWNDALADAGFAPNALVTKRDSAELLHQVADLCRLLGKMPTYIDMRMHVRKDASFPNDKTVAKHFGNMTELTATLRRLAEDPAYGDLNALLPAANEIEEISVKKGTDGFVYLLKSGSHYKIGCTTNLERRIKEVTVAMPEAITLVHSIRTDDPPGIEAYWHKRFVDRRANGEWFKLSIDDLKAFRRRTFQ